MESVYEKNSRFPPGTAKERCLIPLESGTPLADGDEAPPHIGTQKHRFASYDANQIIAARLKPNGNIYDP